LISVGEVKLDRGPGGLQLHDIDAGLAGQFLETCKNLGTDTSPVKSGVDEYIADFFLRHAQRTPTDDAVILGNDKQIFRHTLRIHGRVLTGQPLLYTGLALRATRQAVNRIDLDPVDILAIGLRCGPDINHLAAPVWPESPAAI